NALQGAWVRVRRRSAPTESGCCRVSLLRVICVEVGRNRGSTSFRIAPKTGPKSKPLVPTLWATRRHRWQLSRDQRLLGTLHFIFARSLRRARRVHARGPTNYAPVMKVADSALDHQPALLLRHRDRGLRDAVEFEIIGFDAVAEDHPVLRHLRDDPQRFAAG